MRFLKGCLVVVVVIVVVLSIGVKVAKDQIIAKVAEAAVEQGTGFDLDIQKVHVGLLKPVIEIRGLKLNNPEDYPDREAFEMEELYVRYDRSTLFSDEVLLTELVLDIPKVYMIRKASGESNLERLAKETEKRKKEREQSQQGSESSPGPEADGSGTQPKADQPSKNVRIGTMTLRIGGVEIRDYSSGGEKPQVSTIDINLDRTYTDVASIEDVGEMITQEILIRSLPGLLGGDLDKLLKGDAQSLEQAGDNLDVIGKQLEKSFKGLLKGLEEAQ